jgi:hypothetical protein
MVERHAAAHPDAEVYHWTHVSEPMLEASGYIHDRNQNASASTMTPTR